MSAFSKCVVDLANRLKLWTTTIDKSPRSTAAIIATRTGRLDFVPLMPNAIDLNKSPVCASNLVRRSTHRSVAVATPMATRSLDDQMKTSLNHASIQSLGRFWNYNSLLIDPEIGSHTCCFLRGKRALQSNLTLRLIAQFALAALERKRRSLGCRRK